MFDLFVYLLLSRLAWDPYWIPSSSMKPTLLPGDYITATRVHAYTPHRGDVVVFEHPVNGGAYIKRVIGLPGDEVQMRDGRLYLNSGAVVDKDKPDFGEIAAPQGPARVLPICANHPVRPGGHCAKHRQTQRLPGGAEFDVLDTDDGVLDNTPVYSVPDGHLFVLGDNRDNSGDSRVLRGSGGMGFVPVGNVTARAGWVVFSAAGNSLLQFHTWRPGRYLRPIE